VKTQYMCSEIIQLKQFENGGGIQTSTAILEEISPDSACIQTDAPMPEGTLLRLVCSGCAYYCELEGKVVHCQFRPQLGYFVDVEFAPGSEWCAETYAPAHLWDPASLIEKSSPVEARAANAGSEKKLVPELVCV